MEPGHEDREYVTITLAPVSQDPPQWSPVMKTGNTNTVAAGIVNAYKPQWSPVMKTGNTRPPQPACPAPASLNGARS